MTYYGDENGAVTDLEQNRLDVMPADTLNAPDVPRLERTSGVRVYHSPAIGLEYWVFNLAPRVTSRVHKEVVRSRAIRVALAWAIDRSALVQAALQGYGAPGNTQLSRNYGAYTLDLSKDPVLGYHYDPEKAKRILDQAGWRVGPDGIRRNPDGVRASFELAYAGLSTEKRAVTLIRAWARDVGIEIDVRVYDNDKLINLEFNMDGKKLTPDFDTEIWSIGGDPDARVPALAVHEGPDRRLERLGLHRPGLRAPLQAGDASDRRVARESRTSTRCSASSRPTCPTSSCTSPTTSARSTRAPGRTGRRSPRRTASRSRRTAGARSSR